MYTACLAQVGRFLFVVEPEEGAASPWRLAPGDEVGALRYDLPGEVGCDDLGADAFVDALLSGG